MVSARQIFPLLFLALAACAPTSTRPAAVCPFPPDTSVVFEGEQTRAFSRLCSRRAPGQLKASGHPAEPTLRNLKQRCLRISTTSAGTSGRRSKSVYSTIVDSTRV